MSSVLPFFAKAVGAFFGTGGPARPYTEIGSSQPVDSGSTGLVLWFTSLSANEDVRDINGPLITENAIDNSLIRAN